MPGRPKNQTKIVDSILNPQIIRTELWRLSSLSQEFIKPLAALQWCAARRLIRNSMPCTGCNQLCTLCTYTQGIDGKRWSCQHCNFRKSVRDGSFFSASHLTLQQTVLMVYCWSHDMPQYQISHEANIADLNIITDWCNVMREECESWLERSAGKIGGLDANGEAIVVEIDETKYFHRKYHRGQWHDGHWVFGGVERESGKCFLVEVPDRRAVTLQALIEEYIEPGSHIVSDGWAAYANVDQIGQGIYGHSVVVHQHYFVDPMDDRVHTQNVENMWMRAKRKLKRQFGTSRALFPSYLHEFMYRNQFRGRDIFSNFIVTIAENFVY